MKIVDCFVGHSEWQRLTFERRKGGCAIERHLAQGMLIDEHHCNPGLLSQLLRESFAWLRL